MNKLLPLVTLFLLASPAFSQYCMLPGRTPYASVQPGIINFKFNTINRTSGNSESGSSVVVTTGLSTTLTPGQTYTISITHSEDTQYFPGARNNLRVWMDYNGNFSYADAGETILLADLKAPGTTYTATFTLPVSTPPGTLSLRATAKMSSDAGHTLPTTCDIPTDPLGYHGEMEDYTIVVEDLSQSPVVSFQLTQTVCVNSAATTANTSAGTPAPTYSWHAMPATGVTFSPSSTSTNPKIFFTTPGTYTIMCMATNSLSSNNASKSITVSSCISTGINGIEGLFGISVAPNPAVGILTVKAIGEPAHHIRLVDYTGRLVMEMSNITGGDVTLDVSAVGNGVYFMNIDRGDRTITRKIVIANP